MEINRAGSVRVDLLGGTLDLWPINLIIPKVVTLNLATSLKAKVKLKRENIKGIEIVSKDYGTTQSFAPSEFTQENFNNDHFGPMNFVAQILNHFNATQGMRVELESGSPAGAGLGGSSAMGVTLYAALSEFRMKGLRLDGDKQKAIACVNSIEARILNAGPAGYQDYYPALFGGVLALLPKEGNIYVEQFFNQELKKTLESRIRLVYSGQTRNSGINNWEVYKSFFDKDPHVVKGLTQIAELSDQAFSALKTNSYGELAELIAREGEVRKSLFPNIVTKEMEKLKKNLEIKLSSVGLKVCGAGGGGCFLIIHPEGEQKTVDEEIEKAGMQLLNFEIESPL
jgi:D-glycero-alpha-D-manno-heptose-7-phosphate kinase